MISKKTMGLYLVHRCHHIGSSLLEAQHCCRRHSLAPTCTIPARPQHAPCSWHPHNAIPIPRPPNPRHNRHKRPLRKDMPRTATPPMIRGRLHGAQVEDLGQNQQWAPQSAPQPSMTGDRQCHRKIDQRTCRPNPERAPILSVRRGERRRPSGHPSAPSIERCRR